jgi:hypothetical protein
MIGQQAQQQQQSGTGQQANLNPTEHPASGSA